MSVFQRVKQYARRQYSSHKSEKSLKISSTIDSIQYEESPEKLITQQSNDGIQQQPYNNYFNNDQCDQRGKALGELTRYYNNLKANCEDSESTNTKATESNCDSLVKSDSQTNINPWIEIRVNKGGSNTLYKRKSLQSNVMKFNGHKDQSLSIVLNQNTSTSKAVNENNQSSYFNIATGSTIVSGLTTSSGSKINRERRKRIQSADGKSNYSCMLREMKNKMTIQYFKNQQMNKQSQNFIAHQEKNPFIQYVIKSKPTNELNSSKNQSFSRANKLQNQQKSKKNGKKGCIKKPEESAFLKIQNGNQNSRQEDSFSQMQQITNIKVSINSKDSKTPRIVDQAFKNNCDSSIHQTSLPTQNLFNYARPTTSSQNQKSRQQNILSNNSMKQQAMTQLPSYSMVNFNEYIPDAVSIVTSRSKSSKNNQYIKQTSALAMEKLVKQGKKVQILQRIIQTQKSNNRLLKIA